MSELCRVSTRYGIESVPSLLHIRTHPTHPHHHWTPHTPSLDITDQILVWKSSAQFLHDQTHTHTLCAYTRTHTLSLLHTHTHTHTHTLSLLLTHQHTPL